MGKIINKVKKNIVKGLAALVFASAGLTGCTTFPEIDTNPIEVPAELRFTPNVIAPHSEIEKAAKVLKVPEEEIYLDIPYGYKTTKYVYGTLMPIAGLYAGTCKIGKTKGRYCLITGSFDAFYNSEDLIKALKEADLNKDRIITLKESDNLHARIFKDYLKRNSQNKIKVDDYLTKN